jgi:hypothetical protein
LFYFFAVYVIFQSHLDRNLLVHADQRGHLLFCEEKNLEHEMFPFISPSAQSRLPHEDEAGQENSLYGDDGSEKRKGQRIKVGDSRQLQSVYEDPRNEEKNMDSHESETANDGGGQIPQSFCCRPSPQKLLLMLGDRLYVFLHMVRNLHRLSSRGFLIFNDCMSGKQPEMEMKRLSGCLGLRSI